MNLLLDTHAFIWFSEGDDKLSSSAQQLISDPLNLVHLSLVSVWELQIKTQLGKLTLDNELSNAIEIQVSQNNIQLLPIELKHILQPSNLEDHHRDPFDRLLVAQAQSESMSIITNDNKVKQYQVKTSW